MYPQKKFRISPCARVAQSMKTIITHIYSGKRFPPRAGGWCRITRQGKTIHLLTLHYYPRSHASMLPQRLHDSTIKAYPRSTPTEPGSWLSSSISTSPPPRSRPQSSPHTGIFACPSAGNTGNPFLLRAISPVTVQEHMTQKYDIPGTRYR